LQEKKHRKSHLLRRQKNLKSSQMRLRRRRKREKNRNQMMRGESQSRMK